MENIKGKLDSSSQIFSLVFNASILLDCLVYKMSKIVRKYPAQLPIFQGEEGLEISCFIQLQVSNPKILRLQ